MDQHTGLASADHGFGPAGPPRGVGEARTTLGIPGFGPLTRIETDFGHVPAQTLRVRDRVRLRSGRFCPIARIDRLLLDETFLDRNHDAQPILIQPGRLGYGLPSEAVILAPGQKLAPGQRVPASLCTARELLRAGMAQCRPERFLTYVLVSFSDAEDICAGGLWLRVEPYAPVQSCDDDED